MTTILLTVLVMDTLYICKQFPILLKFIDKPQGVSLPQQGRFQLTQVIPQLPQGVTQPPQVSPHPTSGEYAAIATEDGMSKIHDY